MDELLENFRAFLSELGLVETGTIEDLNKVEQIEAVDQFAEYLPYVTAVLFIYAIYKTVKFTRLKYEYNKLQTQMDHLLLREQEAEKSLLAKADLDAMFVKDEDNHYRLHIVNYNKSLAKNIRINFPDGNNLIIQKDIDAKFPVASLSKHHPITLPIAVYNNAPRKIVVELIWDDGFQTKNTKVVRASY